MIRALRATPMRWKRVQISFNGCEPDALHPRGPRASHVDVSSAVDVALTALVAALLAATGTATLTALLARPAATLLTTTRLTTTGTAALSALLVTLIAGTFVCKHDPILL